MGEITDLAIKVFSAIALPNLIIFAFGLYSALFWVNIMVAVSVFFTLLEFFAEKWVKKYGDKNGKTKTKRL